MFQNVYVYFLVNAAFTNVQITHTMGTTTPPYHDRSWILNFTLVTIWMVFFFFSTENDFHFSSEMLTPHTTFPLCITPVYMSSSQNQILMILCTVKGEIPNIMDQ